jgi:sigma-B regulation protein RsbU (phosphoserine phosphatase)
MAEEIYGAHSLKVEPGDRLYLYSDGLPDARNAAGEQFGDARLSDAIANRRNRPLAEGITTLIAEIAQWQGLEKSQDDISLLAIEIQMPPAA